MRSLGFALLLGGGVTACGVVERLAPDAGDSIDAGDDIDGADGPVALVSTAPAAAALAVDVVPTITLTFSGQLDAASVDGAIQVFERASRRPVPIGAVTWDAATRTVTVTLARPLSYGWTYRVEVDGLTAGGVAVPVDTVRFRTRINQPERNRSYSVTGAVDGRTDDVLAADGGFDRRINYAAGPDAVFDTSDDVITSWYDYSYADDGTNQAFTGHDGPGADTAWFTADDVVISYGLYQYSDAGLYRAQGFTDPGVDRVWRTADDVASYFQEYTYDDADRLVRMRSFASAGADNVRYTADDVLGSVQNTAYRTGGTTLTSYSGPGVDGVWLTGDDPVSTRQESDLDAAGRLTELRVLNPNGTVARYQRYVHDPVTGLPLRWVRWTGAGADALWFTADDVLGSYFETRYDAEHRRVRQSDRDLGPNGVGPDGDDRETSAVFQYDPTR